MTRWNPNGLDRISYEEISLTCEKSNNSGKLYFNTNSARFKSTIVGKKGWGISAVIGILIALIVCCVCSLKSKYQRAA